jgi:hypothetical protein
VYVIVIIINIIFILVHYHLMSVTM